MSVEWLVIVLRVSSLMRRRLSFALLLGALLLVFSASAAAPAAATTVGGYGVSAAGGFVLSAGRLMLPTFSFVYRGEEFEPALDTTASVSIESFGPRDRGWRGLTLESSTKQDFVSGVPAIAVSGAVSAAAWVSGSHLRTALLGERAAGQQTTYPAQGKVGAFDVALDPAGARAVSWSDEAGTHLQIIPELEISSPPAPVSATKAAAMTVTADGGGGWWVVMLAARKLTAIDMSGAGVARRPVQLPYTAAEARRSSHLLVPRSWLALADGHGGLWIGLPRALLHTTATGQVRSVAVGGPMAIAAGQGVSALAQESGRTVAVRTLGVRLGPPIRVSNAGVLMDLAFDASRDVILLLTTDNAGGAVVLREISTSGRIRRSQALPECRHRQDGQIEASEGLVAVSCAGPRVESEQCGGCSSDYRTNHYILLRAGHELRSKAFIEGSEQF
jgi:hypothetical protein